VKPRCISISGADGVGKTTACAALVGKLREEGLRPHQCWLRFRHRVSLPLLAYAHLRGLTRYDGPRVGGERLGRHDFQESSLLRALYPWTIAADLAPAVRWHVHRSLRRQQWVVADRFIPDTLVDLQMATGNESLTEEPVGQALLHLIPEGATPVILDAPEAVVRARRPVHARDSQVGQRQVLYRRLARRFDWPLLDATVSPDRIADQVLDGVSG
jgi:thymidylate kinase